MWKYLGKRQILLITEVVGKEGVNFIRHVNDVCSIDSHGAVHVTRISALQYHQRPRHYIICR